MRRTQFIGDSGSLVLINASTATVDPLTGGQFGVVPSTWTTIDGAIPEFELSVWSAGTVTITSIDLYAGVYKAGAIASDAVESVDDSANTLTFTSHGLLTGDGPWQITAVDNALPGGLSAATDYYTIRASANTIKVATSLENALAGTAVDLTDAGGGGAHTILGTASAKKLRWLNVATISSSLAVTLRKGFISGRYKHNPQAKVYGIAATWGSSVAATFELVPIVER